MMKMYDIFLTNKHSEWMARMMVKNNKRLVDYFRTVYFKRKKKISVLEVGPGKGYFKDAVLSRGGVFEYYAADRNENILRNLGIAPEYFQEAEMPHINWNKKFDMIFVGYVIEHLSNGAQLYDAISNLRSLLKEDGILVLQFPDSMKLGMELYNIDYTHAFATTKRNVNQAVLDNAMYVVKSVDLCGILYTKKVDSRVRYLLKSAVMHFYSYRFVSMLMKVFYQVPLWELRNVFWRAYALLKEPNVMFIVKKKSEVGCSKI